MKRGMFCISLLLAFCLLFLPVIPARAAMEYGAIYDESGLLWTEEAEELGTERFPQFTESYRIDLRVDVLTSIGEFENLAQAAEYLYGQCEYGSEEGGNGVTLTLLVYEDETGIALDEWYPYAAGESWELTTNGTWNMNVGDLLTEEMWAGDLNEDRQVFVSVLEHMVEGLEQFVKAGGVGGTIWSPVYGFVGEEVLQEEPEDEFPEEPVEEVAEEAKETQLDHVTDVAALLYDEEWQDLEGKARALEETYGFGVYIITIDDYTDYTYGDIFDAAVGIYEEYSLGVGAEQDGLLLLLSMEDRDYSLITYGDYGNYAFNDSGREAMTKYFLDDFGEDDWYEGFADYLEWTDVYLKAAEEGEPFSEKNPPMTDAGRIGAIAVRFAAILLIPLAVAAILVGTMSAKMRTVAAATRANAYMKGNLKLSEQYDRYTHTTETRQKINNESSGGGGTTQRSGKASGTSGKF